MKTIYIVYNLDTGVEVGSYLEPREASYLQEELGKAAHGIREHNYPEPPPPGFPIPRSR